jgi:hypothetical protein
VFRRARLLLAAVVVLVLASAPSSAIAASAPTVSILSTHGWLEPDDYVRVVGEVVNHTKTAVTNVKITVDQYDDAGTTKLATETGYTSLNVLGPGDSSPFMVHDKVPGAKKYFVSLTWSTSPLPANHCFKVEVTDTSIDSNGFKHYVGTVTNQNTTPATLVRVDGMFYAADGTIVDTAFAFASNNETHTLQPGESAPFEVVDDGYAHVNEVFVGSSPDAPARPITIALSPTLPIYGSKVILSGAAAPSAAVTVQRFDPVAGWVDLATATADATGAYRTSATIQSNWVLRASTPDGFSVPRAFSEKALVTFTSSVTTVTKGAPVTLSGMVRPAYPGQKVAIQQAVGGTWKTIAYATLTSASSYTYRWVPQTTGAFTLRAMIGNEPDSVTNFSASRRITVH